MERSKWPTLIHRLPGIHIFDFDVKVDRRPVPAIITSIVIYTLNNYDALKKAGSSVYFNVPRSNAQGGSCDYLMQYK